MTKESANTGYRKPYKAEQAAGWWLHNKFYVWYMIREATSVFALLYSALLLLGLWRLYQGEAAWNSWVLMQGHPLFIAFHCCALLAVLFHAATWFSLAPKIMVLRLGDLVVPEKVMVVGQWLGLLVFSVGLILLASGSLS
jgi:fumarate reductase subunit C